MLTIHYHEQFTGNQPALLLAGSRSDISKLLSVFKDWNGQRIDLVEALGRDEASYAAGLTDLVLEHTVGTDWSTCKIDDHRGTWSISKLGQDQIIGLLEGLNESSKPGHQYLEHGSRTIQIVCSKDEYTIRK